jgi:hypothetical protein
MRRLLDDRNLAKRLGENGYLLAMERFTWAAVYERAKFAFEIALTRRDERLGHERRA